MQAADVLLNVDGAALSGLQDKIITLEVGHLVAIGILHAHVVNKGTRTRVVVLHL